MPAPKKEQLEAFESALGLEVGDLTYQQRHKRMAAAKRGESWSLDDANETKEATQPKRGDLSPVEKMKRDAKAHPLQGYKILLAPKMRPDANRVMGFDEPLGPEMEVDEVHAGEAMQNVSAETQRMVADYKVTNVNTSKILYAKTTFPKIGTEMSVTIGDPLPGVIVIEGNQGERGYLWSYKSSVIPIEGPDGNVTMIQLHGLKTLIQQVFPELLPEFSGKQGKVPMSYIDGVTLVAAIPQTLALLRQARMEKMRDAKLYGSN